MNTETLKKAEDHFFHQFPEGFQDPEMLEIIRRHNVNKLIDFAKENLSKDSFTDKSEIIKASIKIVSNSSMVSMFEKPKFRDFAKGLTGVHKKRFVDSLYEQLHGNQQEGFESFLQGLERHKLAKWTLVSALPFYHKPKKEIFIKPTTTKNVIKFFEVNLEYKPKPTWEFYKKYRLEVNKMKKAVDKSLAPSNAAFTGFLMMSMDGLD